MQLQEIYIYPIKSLGGIRLQEAQVEVRGLTYDRRWMLVDDKGLFLTQRKHHHMALLQVDLQPSGLRVYHKHNPERQCFVPFSPKSGQSIKVTVWDDTVDALVVSEEVSQWFTGILGISCQLVFMPEATSRPIDEKYAVHQETVSFADAMPYLLIGQSSLDDLNNKLEEAVPMNRFRPNFVFTGAAAFEEDTWSQIKIGTCTFKITKPCARCVMTTVDQETGTSGKEPLKTLASYRSVNKKVLFGQNMIALTGGKIKIGDQLTPL
ncbi:MAG TPA: MOSC N-terminal beta barrel domain-containing protein [Cyclobacteriaceae bacterium]|nr:MOSC N-terminal beta barrel domain-containing protein [Cyclobacteriaceae bacterium]